MSWWMWDWKGWLAKKLYSWVVETIIAKEKLKEKEQEVNTLKNLLVKEVQEKHGLKEEFDKFKVDTRVMVIELVKSVIKWVVDDTWKSITDNYILLPKPKESMLAAALAGYKPLLGQTSPYPYDKKDST